MLIACGIPSSQQYPPLPSVDPGQSKVTAAEMSFTGAGDPAIGYRLWYKIYPWKSDSEVADLVNDDVNYFDDNIVREQSDVESQEFRRVHRLIGRNRNLDDDLLGVGNVVIDTNGEDSLTLTIGGGQPIELGRYRYLTDKVRYKGFFGEFESSDDDVRSRWNKFTVGGDFAVLFLVQSVRLDGQLLKRLYSTPLVVGYYVIKGKFDNKNG